MFIIDSFMTFFIDDIVHGKFEAQVAALIVAVVLSMLVLHFVFKYFSRFVAKRNDLLYRIIYGVFRGIPELIGIQWGMYFCLVSFSMPPMIYSLLYRMMCSVAILTVTIIVAHIVSGYLKYKLAKRDEQNGASSILVSVIDVSVYVIGVLVLLESFGVSITPMLTALGVGGMATALALQDTLSNLFAGINTLISKQIKLGDFVKLASGESGHIVDMNWRNTTIKTITDNMIVVPNKNIASSVIINYAQPYESCSMIVPVGVSYDSDLQKVERVTLEVAKKILLENDGGVAGVEPLVRYRAFGDYSIDFDVILRVKTILDQSLMRHLFIKALYERYKQEHIVIPVHS